MTTATLDPLFRTDGGTRLHIAPCYRIHAKQVLEATEQERQDMPVCDNCQHEIDGHGRTPFEDLDSALRAFGAYADTFGTIKGLLADVGHDAIWLPYSASYVALGRDGKTVASVGKTYVDYADRPWVELPGYRAGGGGGTPAEERLGEVCDQHFVTRSTTGSCESCED